MTTLRMPTDRYFQQLRVLGAWWRLGSSVLDPQRLVEAAPPTPLDGAEAALNL